ncbi:MAG: hypothetical protein EBZ29_09940 [Synechococcaceae bacterium WB9_4xC_028]|nr:hypothetical protein [Synechococcaceae bacterium WB9_4xC_028]
MYKRQPEDSEAFAQRLLKTMRAFGGIGLAAPQVEQYYKVFVVHAEQPFAAGDRGNAHGLHGRLCGRLVPH